MNKLLWTLVLIAASGAAQLPAHAQAAKKTTAGKPVKRRTFISGDDATSKAAKGGGADSSEGWIVKRTKDGKIIKIPRKQTFKFGGSEVSGEANRPNETLLGSRLTPREATLIPERKSYRSEFLESVGFQERNRK